MASLRSSSPAAMALAQSWRILSSIMRGERHQSDCYGLEAVSYTAFKVSHHTEGSLSAKSSTWSRKPITRCKKVCVGKS
jgi:hypothetical protein